MKIKVYGVRGYIEKVAELHVGKAKLPVHFKDGNINATLSTPAQYRTARPIEQSMIENSVEFKKGLIFIADVFDDGKDDETQSSVANNAKASTEPEVTAEVKKFSTLADAKEYLKENGIVVDSIRLKPDAIEMAKANGLNIEFTR